MRQPIVNGFRFLPPQLDVNLGLVTTQSPELNFVNVYKDYSEVVFSQYMDISTINSNTISFMQNGREIIGAWEAIDKEVSATDTSIYYAKTFKFVPEDNFNGNINVKIANVKNYADIKIEAEYTNTFYVNNPITSFETPKLVEISYEENTSFVIKATPVAAAKNKTVTIVLSNDYVVQCADKVTLDENGEAIINLKSLLPGEVKLQCEIEGTTISNTVNIVSTINESLLSKKEYSITWIIDEETTIENYMVDELIIAPVNIFKKGFIFSGWSADIPQTMPGEDLTFEAMFIECEHSLADWEIVSPATCTEAGEKEKSCACGINLTDIIPATNHPNKQITYLWEPTCESQGFIEKIYCPDCNNQLEGVGTIEPKGHNYENDICKNCGMSRVDNCICMCHKNGVMGVVWKIFKVILKIFNANPTCSCNVAHY